MPPFGEIIESPEELERKIRAIAEERARLIASLPDVYRLPPPERAVRLAQINARLSFLRTELAILMAKYRVAIWRRRFTGR